MYVYRPQNARSTAVHLFETSVLIWNIGTLIWDLGTVIWDRITLILELGTLKHFESTGAPPGLTPAVHINPKWSPRFSVSACFERDFLGRFGALRRDEATKTTGGCGRSFSESSRPRYAYQDAWYTH